MQKIKQVFTESVKWWTNLIWKFFTCKDMKALYWYILAQSIAGGGDILIQQLTAWDPNNIITVIVGLIISRITKKLNK